MAGIEAKITLHCDGISRLDKIDRALTGELRASHTRLQLFKIGRANAAHPLPAWPTAGIKCG